MSNFGIQEILLSFAHDFVINFVSFTHEEKETALSPVTLFIPIDQARKFSGRWFNAIVGLSFYLL